jgi:hypothetical protein
MSDSVLVVGTGFAPALLVGGELADVAVLR